jgi:hypothetical protein
MPDTMYLQLVDGVGAESDFRHEQDKDGLYLPNPKAGDPAPLTSVGIQVPVPTKIEGGDIIETTRSVTIAPSDQRVSTDWRENPVGDDGAITVARIIPGTRVIETTAPPIANVLTATGHYQPCEPPASEQPRKPKPSAPESEEVTA